MAVGYRWRMAMSEPSNSDPESSIGSRKKKKTIVLQKSRKFRNEGVCRDTLLQDQDSNYLISEKKKKMYMIEFWMRRNNKCEMNYSNVEYRMINDEIR